MKKTSFVSAALLSVEMLFGFTSLASANSTYVIDTAGVHYYAGFQISHLGFSTMHGRFDTLSGTIKYDDAEPTNSQVSVTIKASSINTNMAKRDAHLKSPDFFNVEEFSDITFVSTKLVKMGEKTAKMTGNLTMMGVTRSITLDTTLINIGANPFSKAPTAAWSARGTIKRSDFGSKYGAPAIGDEVTLIIDIEALKQ
jgi:polyisoprenoid-binding protein YceI